MKFEELKSKYENQESFLSQLEIKNRVSIIEKESAVKSIVETSIRQSDITPGIYELNYVNNITSMATCLVSLYTNIELTEENIYDEIDWIRYYVLDDIKKEIGKDLEEFEEMVDIEINNVLNAKNSIEGILITAVNSLLNKIPDEKGVTKIINNLTKKIEKISKNMKPEQLEQFKKMLTPIDKG